MIYHSEKNKKTITTIRVLDLTKTFERLINNRYIVTRCASLFPYLSFARRRGRRRSRNFVGATHLLLFAKLAKRGPDAAVPVVRATRVHLARPDADRRRGRRDEATWSPGALLRDSGSSRSFPQRSQTADKRAAAGGYVTLGGRKSAAARLLLLSRSRPASSLCRSLPPSPALPPPSPRPPSPPPSLHTVASHTSTSTALLIVSSPSTADCLQTNPPTFRAAVTTELPWIRPSRGYVGETREQRSKRGPRSGNVVAAAERCRCSSAGGEPTRLHCAKLQAEPESVGQRKRLSSAERASWRNCLRVKLPPVPFPFSPARELLA